jgi:hypothetical protein
MNTQHGPKAHAVLINIIMNRFDQLRARNGVLSHCDDGTKIMVAMYLDELQKNLHHAPDIISLADHLDGFDQDFNNSMLHFIDQAAASQDKKLTVRHHNVIPALVQKKYSNLEILFDIDWHYQANLAWFEKYRMHPDRVLDRFVCSFNGADHVGRKLLVAVLHRLRWFDLETCSKNLVFSADQLDGHIRDIVGETRSRIYRKFFIGKDSDEFFQTVNSFGHNRYQHDVNIVKLEQHLTRCFVHVVSETMSTSYVPFVTEKFLYSIVTRGLFLGNAALGWHAHIEKYYGFRMYDSLFDYGFDSVTNPVQRLLALMSELLKFSTLSCDDWQDLYQIESDTIEFNYDHYHSGNYLKCLEKSTGTSYNTNKGIIQHGKTI